MLEYSKVFVMSKTPERDEQRGALLMIILICVILFAALSYAVTASLRGSGKNSTSENYTAMASNIIQYGSLLQNTIQRFMLTNNCRDTDIDFFISGVTNGNYSRTPAAPSNCNVFTSAGGNVALQKIRDLIDRQGLTFNYDDYSTGSDIMSVGTNCTNDNCVDLYWIIQLNVIGQGGWTDTDRFALCRAYNNLANGTTNIPTLGTGITMLPFFNGTYGYINQITGLNGQNTGCYVATNLPGRLFIYYVLLPR